MAWRPGRDAFYYARDSVRGGPRVWLHEAGTPAGDDAQMQAAEARGESFGEDTAAAPDTAVAS